MDCSLPGSSVHGIFQARVLERVVITFSGGSLVKNLPTMWETWVGNIHCRRERLPTPVFWPGEFSPWGLKELDRTEQLSFSFIFFFVSASSHFKHMKALKLESREFTNFGKC